MDTLTPFTTYRGLLAKFRMSTGGVSVLRARLDFWSEPDLFGFAKFGLKKIELLYRILYMYTEMYFDTNRIGVTH